MRILFGLTHIQCRKNSPALMERASRKIMSVTGKMIATAEKTSVTVGRSPLYLQKRKDIGCKVSWDSERKSSISECSPGLINPEIEESFEASEEECAKACYYSKRSEHQ